MRHPLARAAELLGFQLDVVTVLEAVGTEIDQRVQALAAEVDPVAGLTERDAIVTRLGDATAGVNVETYAGWYGPLIRTLNAHTKRWYPDWAARPGLLLNEWPYGSGRA